METTTVVPVRTEVVASPVTAVVVFDPASLPAEPLSRVQKNGDLINPKDMTQAQITQAQKIATGFNLGNTAAVLRFAEDPQVKLSAYLDELMADIRVKDAGVAGDIAKQLAAGIDLMQLGKVKEQIVSGTGTSIVARLFYWCGAWTNYLRNFYLSQQPILTLVRQIESKALRKLRHPTRSRRIKAFLDMAARDAENLF